MITYVKVQKPFWIQSDLKHGATSSNQQHSDFKIIEIFPFFQEFHILQARLENGYDYVEKFIISEFGENHHGHKKPLHLNISQNWEKLSKYHSKLVYLPYKRFPTLYKSYPQFLVESINRKRSGRQLAWIREAYQRQVLLDYLKLQYAELPPSELNLTYIIHSDLDEVPNYGKYLPLLLNNTQGLQRQVVHMRLYSYIFGIRFYLPWYIAYAPFSVPLKIMLDKGDEFLIEWRFSSWENKLDVQNIVVHCTHAYLPSELQKKYEGIVEGQTESSLSKEKDLDAKFHRIFRAFDDIMNIRYRDVHDINDTQLNDHANFPPKFIKALPNFVKQTRMERSRIWNLSLQQLNISKEAFLNFVDSYENNDGLV